MSTLDKVRFIESSTVPKVGIRIEAYNTSLHITHRCGCILVHHGTGCFQTMLYPNDTYESYGRRQAEREYYVNLCQEHFTIFRQQIAQKEFISLRNECFRCISETIEASENNSSFKLMLADIQPKVCVLEDRLSVRNTFKGIIGYHIWSSKSGHLDDSFIQAALYNLQDCVEYHNEDWYSPRTSRYIEYYSPINS